MEIFQDKEAKISFLQKAIDVVVMVSGEPLSAKPARIVAGHEPERTNELLQRIGKCCLSKVTLWPWHYTLSETHHVAGKRLGHSGRCSRKEGLGTSAEPRALKLIPLVWSLGVTGDVT